MFSTRKDHARHYQKIARTEWFKDHEVHVTTYEGGYSYNPIVVVDFRKPGTCIYAVRYVYDGNRVYVSGDLGDAVFNCTWKTKPIDSTWNSLWYVFEKLSASEQGKEMDYNAEVCISTIKNTLFDRDPDEAEAAGESPYPENWGEEEKSAYLALINGAMDTAGMDHWNHVLSEIDGEHHLSIISSDWWEWLYGAAKVMPPRIVGIITGLQIVSERLEAVNWTEQQT